jgi:hypothetical protein
MSKTVLRSWLFSLSLLTPFADTARAVEIAEHHCVEARANAVHTLFTRYSDYATMPGSAYTVGLAGAKVDLIKMIKSQAKKVSESGRDSKNLVWIVLQPALVEDSKVYPRFLLDCAVSWTDVSAFKQNCALQKDKQHYGLDDLTIAIEVKEQDSTCKPHETGIRLRINITGNEKEIAEIKKATLAPAGMLAPLISALFNEDAFFRNYFRNIYDEWIKTL